MLTGGGGGKASKVDSPSGLTEWAEPVNDDVRYSFVVRVFYVKDDVTSGRLAAIGGVEIGECRRLVAKAPFCWSY